MTVQHVTLGDLIDIRDRVAIADPWRYEIVNSSGLLSALTTPFQAAFGQESFPELNDKAAALIFLLIANHPFRDGNKRIATEAMRLFLARNGQELQADEDELRTLTQLATGTHDARDPRLLAWLANHTQSMPPSAPAAL